MAAQLMEYLNYHFYGGALNNAYLVYVVKLISYSSALFGHISGKKGKVVINRGE
jgi:hypothetical protein